jgi:hypothetical protein
VGGRVEILDLSARSLAGNALGDPDVRRTPVYLPPQYEREPTRRFPVIYNLHGFTGSAFSHLNFQPWQPTSHERLEAAIVAEEVPPCVYVLVDGWTKLGGSQYVNSTAIGRYFDYVVQDVVGHVDRTFRTIAHRDARAVMGKSSGGYGALVMAAYASDVFGLVADHSGDAGFYYCYLPDFPKAADALRKAGGLRKWLEAFWERARTKKVESGDHPIINTVAMAAAYSPDPDREMGIALPFDLETGELDEAVWARWLERDPVRFLPPCADRLRGLRLLYMDCGTKDQFNIQWGSRQISRKLTDAGVPHRYEEFDDDHMNVQYRYERSFRLLGKAIRTES